MRINYAAGNYGYGHAKQALFKALCEQFKEARERYDHLMNHKEELDMALEEGAIKARLVADEVLKRVRSKVGY
jgi:tryptophanyl-tRNA synthetase